MCTRVGCKNILTTVFAAILYPLWRPLEFKGSALVTFLKIAEQHDGAIRMSLAFSKNSIRQLATSGSGLPSWVSSVPHQTGKTFWRLPTCFEVELSNESTASIVRWYRKVKFHDGGHQIRQVCNSVFRLNSNAIPTVKTMFLWSSY